MQEKGLAVQEQRQITPMSLIQDALAGGAAIDTIERLVAMQRDQRDYDAKVDFENAMHRCQTKMRPIRADLNNPQTKSKYASYAQLDKVLRPLYTDEGFSLSFNTGESSIPDHTRILCYVSREGHTRTYQTDMPADGKGAKGGDVMTKTHAMGAAMSYGMRYLLKMIFNVAVGEDDRDGNTDKEGRMDGGEIDRYVALIEGARTLPHLKEMYEAAYHDAFEIGDMNALRFFLAKKDARRKELAG